MGGSCEISTSFSLAPSYLSEKVTETQVSPGRGFPRRQGPSSQMSKMPPPVTSYEAGTLAAPWVSEVPMSWGVRLFVQLLPPILLYYQRLSCSESAPLRQLV